MIEIKPYKLVKDNEDQALTLGRILNAAEKNPTLMRLINEVEPELGIRSRQWFKFF
jgi:hypothetical protein